MTDSVHRPHSDTGREQLGIEVGIDLVPVESAVRKLIADLPGYSGAVHADSGGRPAGRGADHAVQPGRYRIAEQSSGAQADRRGHHGAGAEFEAGPQGLADIETVAIAFRQLESLNSGIQQDALAESFDTGDADLFGDRLQQRAYADAGCFPSQRAGALFGGDLHRLAARGERDGDSRFAPGEVQQQHDDGVGGQCREGRLLDLGVLDLGTAVTGVSTEVAQALGKFLHRRVATVVQLGELLRDRGGAGAGVALLSFVGGRPHLRLELLQFGGSLIPGVTEGEHGVLVALRIGRAEVEGLQDPRRDPFPHPGDGHTNPPVTDRLSGPGPRAVVRRSRNRLCHSDHPDTT
ncbi:hypothetical protein [Nocardia sp. alder85J]|uniref:hypothetical protein n=1 Tax=Nocardia sp. alder85J TaxID=2862949 RepID=UPI001CD7B6CD|nr:hypothetical protein [Nocardia sp. alder85J]MCX4093044.1 hypothetical protein [Nocardia sp. alder85J]